MTTKGSQHTEEVVQKETYLRLAADFENYRKRTEGPQGGIAQAVIMGKTAVITDILDLLDELESAKGQGEWTRGLELITDKFVQALSRHGLERIETVGRTFDPVTMEAIGTAPGGEANTVQSQHRAGWSLDDRVIRPARVIIYQ